MRGLLTGVGIGYILFTENGHKMADKFSNVLVNEGKKQMNEVVKEVKATYNQLKEVPEQKESEVK